MIRLLAIFGAEAVLFLVLTINYRACAKGWVKTTVSTDAVIAGLNFSLIKWIAETGSLGEHGAYIAGAMVGSTIGMWITQHWKDAESQDWTPAGGGGRLIEVPCSTPTPSNCAISSGSCSPSDQPSCNR